MAYIGNSLTQQSFTGGMDQFNGNASNTTFGLSRTITTAFDINVYVEGVFQRPGVAYTVSANTISFTSAPSAGANNIVVVYENFTSTSMVPQDGTVTTSKLGTITNVNAGAGAGLTLQANSTTAVYISSNTNVGVSTVSPSYMLEVGNTSGTQTVTQAWRNNGSQNLAVILAAAGKDTKHLGVDVTNNTLYLGRDTSTKDLTVAANGNVGIATSSATSTLTVNGSITSTGNVTAASVNYVAGHPLSFKGCMTWIDLDQSYTYTDSPTQYGVRDLATPGLSWMMRSQNHSGYRDCSTTSASGTSKRVLRTGTTTSDGVIANWGARYDRLLFDMAHTYVFWVWRGSGSIQSNETLISQYNTVNGTNYQIIRAYPTYWDFYNNSATDAQMNYTNTGGFNTAAWTMMAFVSYNGKMRAYKYNQSNQTGVYDEASFTQNWQWYGTGGSRAMMIGGSEWGSNSGEPWGFGSNTATGTAYMGPFMWYNSALSQTELTSLFNYYKSSFSIT